MNSKIRFAIVAAIMAASFATAAPAAASNMTGYKPPTSQICTFWAKKAKADATKDFTSWVVMTPTEYTKAGEVYSNTLATIESDMFECDMSWRWFELAFTVGSDGRIGLATVSVDAPPPPAPGPAVGPSVLPVTGAGLVPVAPTCVAIPGAVLLQSDIPGVVLVNATSDWLVPARMSADAYGVKYAPNMLVPKGASTLFCVLAGASLIGSAAPAGGPPAAPAPSGAGPAAAPAPAVNCAVPVGISLISQTGTMAKIMAPGPFTVPMGWAVNYRDDLGNPKYVGGNTVPVEARNGYEATLWAPDACKGKIH